MRETIEDSLCRVSRWVEDHEYKAYDPGDGQLSYLRFLTGDRPSLRRLLTAVVLRAPFNIRPLLGIRPHVSTKGMGYMAWGYSKLYAHTKDRRYESRARFCLEWLIQHRAPKSAQYCWGNHFPFSTRAGTIPALEPTIVWSSLIGLAFLEAYEVFGDPKHLGVASSTAAWILSLPRENTKAGCCLSYVACGQSSIHNSNLLGAALLARVGRITANRAAFTLAREAVMYTCSRQNPDGSWYYGEEPKYHWIDNFHTGYNLDSLKRYRDSASDRSFDDHIRRGLDYFKRHFFEPNGRPKYYHNQAYPIDIQCAAQAIDTLTFFSDEDSEVLPLAQKVAAWTIGHMQAKDGHFYYRDLGWTKNKTPMLHWGQGTMFKALAGLLARLEEKPRAGSASADTNRAEERIPNAAESSVRA
ncbi:MAG: hypothetical protein ACLQU3_11810 [Limisphaerales bacterium]